MTAMMSYLCRLRPLSARGARSIASSAPRLDEMRLRSSAQDFLYRGKLAPRGMDERLRSLDLPKIDLNEEQRAMFNTVKDCIYDSNWEGALEVYQKLPQEIDSSWQPVMRVILNCFCKSLRYREAAMVFERFPARDTLAYNMYLNLLARLKHTRDFDRVLRRMEDENIPQSSVTICAILSMCKETSDWQQALQLLEGLKSDTDADSSIEIPYLLAMTACARARAKDKVNELFQEGKQNANFRVKCSHYNTLIVACGTDAAAAREVVDQMKADGFEPSGSDWRALLSAHREDLQGQRGIYSQMREVSPSEPLEEAWAILLRSAIEEDNSDAVNWVMEEMSRNGCSVDSEQAARVPSLRRAVAQLSEWQQLRQLGAPAEADAPAEAPAASEASEAALPEGWQSTLDPSSGQRYYWHAGDPAGTTTWERPS